MTRKNLIRILVFLCFQNSNAQELSLYQNYLQNNFYNLNPAAAGFDGAFISQLSVSKKWMGFAQSPTNQVFSNSIRLGDEEFYDPDKFINRPFINLAPRVGIGISIFNETSGPLRHTGALFAYAYHIAIHDNRLSFGLSGLITQYKLDAQLFKPKEDDPDLFKNTSAIVPDLNIGALFYNLNFFLGISANGLYNFNKVMDHSKTMPGMVYCIGYRYKLSGGFSTEPSVFVMKELNVNATIDFNNKLYYRNRNWLMLSYRSSGEAVAGIGLILDRGLQFSYSFALSTNGIASYNAGSHCISLRADIVKLMRRHNIE